MQKSNEKYYLAFSYLLDISPLFKKKLFEFFNFDIKLAWYCQKADLKKFEGVVPRYFFDKKAKINPDEVFEEILSEGFKYITFEDEKYPKLLKEIVDYPLLLYYKGDFNVCHFDKTLAVVGSRKASESAKSALSGIISKMKDLPVTIVSGLAMGIDAVAHRSALANNLATIGVIGSGFNFVYPSVNKDLYKKIEEDGGLILSEYPPFAAPIPQNFPQRNRIVTGLSFGTLVAEAALRSGALISANLTLEQGRDVMCIPGLITNPNTEGIYKLIKEGAPIVTTAEDIFEILNWDFEEAKSEIKLTLQEKNVFDIIAKEPVSFEKIQMCIQEVNSSELMITLTGLELRGLIKQINGQYLLG